MQVFFILFSVYFAIYQYINSKCLYRTHVNNNLLHTCESPITFCSLRAHRKSMAWRCIYNLAITKKGGHAIFDTPSLEGRFWKFLLK